MYRNDTEIAFMIFDGGNVGLTDWFTVTRIIQSTWSNIAGKTFAAFTMAG